jgi:hypothetical protein
MPVHHRGDLADDLPVRQRDDEVVARCSEVRSQDFAIDGEVQDVVGDALEEALVAGLTRRIPTLIRRYRTRSRARSRDR